MTRDTDMKDGENNKLNFVTLFDSNYLDRAIVMHESLLNVEGDFTLYIIAIDDKCAEVLEDMKLGNVVVIRYDEFEDDVLRKARSNRTMQEFLWTCSSYSLKYIMDRFNTDHCTYIDADMYFYNSPRRLVEDFLNSGCDVAIIPHNFSDHKEYKRKERESGRYCVEFNTFRNNEGGRRILNWWVDRCLEKCVASREEGFFGDQKYLDEFTSLFQGVYIYEDPGAGVAPWNVDAYRWDDREHKRIVRTDRNSEHELIFYHFHSLSIAGNVYNYHVFTRPGKHDKVFVYDLYKPYCRSLFEVRNSIGRHYGLYSLDGSKENASDIKKKPGEKWKVLSDFVRESSGPVMLAKSVFKHALFRKYDIFCVNGNDDDRNKR